MPESLPIFVLLLELASVTVFVPLPEPRGLWGSFLLVTQGVVPLDEVLSGNPPRSKCCMLAAAHGCSSPGLLYYVNTYLPVYCFLNGAELWLH